MSQQTNPSFSSLQSLLASQHKQSQSSGKNSSKRNTSNQPKLSIPTDDEIGSQLIRSWKGDYAYFWERWNRYEKGFWREERNIDFPIWGAMKSAKPLGYRPTNGKCKSIEGYLRSHLRVPDEKVDCQDHLINLRNGVYDLKAGKLILHQREFYQTYQLGFEYDPAADCPLWKKCQDQWLTTPSGEPDREVQMVVQEALGYTLTSDTFYQSAFILYGPAASGKSQLLEIIQALLGKAHVALNLSDLDKNSYQLASVLGKRAVTCTEAASGALLKDDVFKQLVSGEEMVFRQIYKAPFQYIPKVKLWWGLNELLQNRDSSNAVYRRVKIIPFHRAIPAEEQDPTLGEKLRAELPGIFNWALEGLARLQANNGFTRATQIDEQVQLYKAKNDVEAAFLTDTEWIVRGTGGETRASDFMLLTVPGVSVRDIKPSPALWSPLTGSGLDSRRPRGEIATTIRY